ncbi:MAG: hypothetical protein SFV15_08695 [Polyangiaceae bacterium]|nr:hypothetical protein [Polyangiaceae bacterium]
MRHQVRNWLGVIVGLLGWCHPFCASAAPSSAEIAVARRLFKDAVALEERKRWAEAAQKLREAIAIKDTPGLRFHLANAEMEQGHLVEALVEYDRADELIAAGEAAPDVAELLAPAREELRKRVPTVHVVGLASEAGVTLSIDGRTVASSLLAHPIPQNPGTHKLVVQSPGHQRAVFEVDLREGERRQIHVNLAAEAAPPEVRESTMRESLTTGGAEPKSNTSAPAAREPSGGNTARTVVVVSEVVLTAAGLGVGAGFLLKQSSIDDRSAALNRELGMLTKESSSASICSAAPDAATESKCADFRQTLVDSKRARDIAVAGFVGAGVAGVATVITLIVWDTNASDGARSTSGRWHAGLTPLGTQGAFATFSKAW